MDSFAFDPATGFNDTDSYPDPASGTAARTQLMSLHTQTQTFINDQLVPAITSLQTALGQVQLSLAADEQAIAGLTSSINALATSITTAQLITSGIRFTSGGKTYNLSVDADGNVIGTEV